MSLPSSLFLSLTLSFLAIPSALSEMVSAKHKGTDTGVHYYKVRYRTTDAKGKPTIASGLVTFPVRPLASRWPNRDEPSRIRTHWVSYQHGTTSLRTAVPSNALESTNEGSIAVKTLSAAGYIVVAADGLGLGDSSGIHPLLHASSSAIVSADLLTAASQFLRRRGVEVPPKLFLAGYSAGAHWTLALQRHLESKPRNRFAVDAVFAMNGPYDLSGTMLRHILHTPGTYTSYFSSYAIYSMHHVYGGIYRNLEQAFQSPYAEKIPSLYDGTKDSDEIVKLLPEKPVDLYQADYLDALETNPSHSLTYALARNNVYDWSPRAPLVLIHSRGDREVPIENAETLQAKMAEKGIEVPLIETTGELDHAAAFAPALAEAIKGMAARREAETPGKTPSSEGLEESEERLEDVLAAS